MRILKSREVLHFLINRIIKAALHKETFIQCFGQVTTERTVKQGCRLFPKLFTLVLDEIIQDICKIATHFIRNVNNSVDFPVILAYARDLLAISKKEEDLTNLLDALKQSQRNVRLQVNNRKNAIMIRSDLRTTKIFSMKIKITV